MFRMIAAVTVVLSVYCFGVLVVSAQDSSNGAPRTITALSDNLLSVGAAGVTIPDSGDNIDISVFTVEMGEPGASCTGAALTRTAWFMVSHPGGALDINTAALTGSAFDTVAQLFAGNTFSVGSLVEVGCDDNSGGGPGGNNARLLLPDLASGVYYGRISCIANCGASNDLALSVTYTPDDPVPPNDNLTQALPVRIGRVVTAENVEHASVEIAEAASLGCVMYHTVWYRLIVPYTGLYSFSTFNSILRRGDIFGPDAAALAVYESSGGANVANFTQLGCSSAYLGTNYGALPVVSLVAGEEIYVRVGSFRPSNLLDGSLIRLKTMIVNVGSLLVNGGFETGALTPWTLTHVGADDGVSSAFVLVGSYSLRMGGAPGKTNKLKQKWAPALFDIRVVKGTVARVLLYHGTNGTLSDKAKAIVKIAYSDGTPPTVRSVGLFTQIPAGYFLPYYVEATAARSAVANITVMVKNKSSGGYVYIDEVSLRLYGGDMLRAAKSVPGVLPPPAPLDSSWRLVGG